MGLGKALGTAVELVVAAGCTTMHVGRETSGKLIIQIIKLTIEFATITGRT